MNTWKNLRIRTLIEENQSHRVLQQCTSLLERTDIKSNISHLVLVQDLIGAYEQDDSSNSGKPINVDGHSELLSALHSTEETYLRLITLKTADEDTVVFTDPNLNQVIGALRILRTKRRFMQPAALTKDQQFYNAIGQEVGPQACREPDCARLRVSGSVRCRNHLFEMVKGRTYKPESSEASNASSTPQKKVDSNKPGFSSFISALS